MKESPNQENTDPNEQLIADMEKYIGARDFDSAYKTFEGIKDENEKIEAAIIIAAALLGDGNDRGAQLYIEKISSEWDQLAAIFETTLRVQKAHGGEKDELIQDFMRNMADIVDREKAEKVLQNMKERVISPDEVRAKEAQQYATSGDLDAAIERANTLTDDHLRAKIFADIAWEMYRGRSDEESENEQKARLSMAQIALEQIMDKRDKMAAAMHILIRGGKEGNSVNASMLAIDLLESADIQKAYSALTGMNMEKAKEGGTEPFEESHEMWNELEGSEK